MTNIDDKVLDVFEDQWDDHYGIEPAPRARRGTQPREKRNEEYLKQSLGGLYSALPKSTRQRMLHSGDKPGLEADVVAFAVDYAMKNIPSDVLHAARETMGEDATDSAVAFYALRHNGHIPMPTIGKARGKLMRLLDPTSKTGGNQPHATHLMQSSLKKGGHAESYQLEPDRVVPSDPHADLPPNPWHKGGIIGYNPQDR